MLEKERKLTKKRVFVLLMAMVMCLGASVSVLAATRTGSILGLNYTFEGSYTAHTFKGKTEVENLAKNPASYVDVKIINGTVTMEYIKVYGYIGNKAEGFYKWANGSAGWKIFHSTVSKGNGSTTSVYQGGYTLY